MTRWQNATNAFRLGFVALADASPGVEGGERLKHGDSAGGLQSLRKKIKKQS